MNQLKKVYFIALCFCILYSIPTVAQTDKDKLEQDLKFILNSYEAVGMSIVVVKDNQLIYQQSLGYSDLENEVPLKTDNLFRIASISKSFTATALLQLVEQGRISLQDNVSDLIGFPVVNPKYPDKVITLEMLLSHRTSINDSQKYNTLDIINPAKNPKYAKSYGDYAPGTKYRYTNMGYNLAGAILEKLHGKRFDVVIHEQILKPLGMKAGFNVDSLDKSKFASIYIYKKGSQSFIKSQASYRSTNLKDYRIGYDAARFSPTGGLKVSALDLAKYMQMHMNYGVYDGHRVLSDSLAHLMQQPFSKMSGIADYGLGLLSTKGIITEEKMVGHTGAVPGLRSAMYFEPQKKFGFIVVTNGTNPAFELDGYPSLLNETIRLLYSHFIKQ
ncbi:beta-lactamase family protein [Sphingobacterium sp. SGG-5]|uniref:serine hydrolase domain-containing protein n=1 Tax=Sphingobacterium sp. SGG-5 TaxID=2710881 RepID=UPI0013EC26FB|nr:serine hydrolase domain-containing protein [Sphingobacterium sp. SGG-5]NGM61313.1 beta-lactamase family protein [Sphingobacterium sp. SGG-5]